MSSPDVPAPVGASPLPTVTPPHADRPIAGRRRGRWSVVVLAVVGAACLIAVVPMYRHGVVAHPFPSYVQGDPVYEVRRYSAPWVGGGAALGGIGLVCWAVAVTLLLQGRRTAAATAPVPAAGPEFDAPPAAPEPGLTPRPTEAAREF